MLLCDKVIFYTVFKAKILVNVAERKRHDSNFRQSAQSSRLETIAVYTIGASESGSFEMSFFSILISKSLIYEQKHLPTFV